MVIAVRSEIAIAEGRLSLHVGSQRQQRKRVPVIGVGEIEHLREASAGAVLFIPDAVLALSIEQILDSLWQTRAAGIADGENPQNSPSRLGECAYGFAGCT